jgi:DNA polymerase delta subunit 1
MTWCWALRCVGVNAVPLPDPFTGAGAVRLQVEDDLASILGYQLSGKMSFFRIYVAAPNLVPTVKRALEDGVVVPGYGQLPSLMSYESNVPFVLRFMIDRDITAAGWLEIPAGTYSVRPSHQKESHCQIEVDVVHEYVIGHKAEGVWSKLAPIRILSLDIECQVGSRVASDVSLELPD